MLGERETPEKRETLPNPRKKTPHAQRQRDHHYQRCKMGFVERENTCPSSSSPHETDDLTLFLHQILHHSSSSSGPHPSSLLSGFGCHVTDRISTSESPSGFNSSSGAVFSSSGYYFPTNASSSVGNVEIDPDEYDGESEEGFETLAEEVLAKQVPSRNSLKRGRAAEFHNLSEKRRRSLINEKMKALQNLIPNSNKTDKASMLDDAIEYLKQLQLRVQMLTMRNGLSLYPMCLPGALQPAQLTQMAKDFYEGNGTDVTGMSFNPETSTSSLFNIPNQNTNPGQLTAIDLSSALSSETSFGRESAIEGHLRPLQLRTSSRVKEIYREDMPPDQQLDVDDHSLTNPLGFETGAKATVAISFNTQASDVKDKVLEACTPGTQRPENVLL